MAKKREEIVIASLGDITKKAVEQAKEKGASSWLSTLLLQEQGFALNKGEFRDALAIRYNSDLRGLPSKCSCEQPFNFNHATTSGHHQT